MLCSVLIALVCLKQNLATVDYAVNSFRLKFNIDIYITGSNAYLMSSNLTTLLSGRTNSVPIYPLSFREFCEFLGLIPEKNQSKLSTNQWQFKNSNTDINFIFNYYLTYGGFPGLIDFNFDEYLINNTLEELYEMVILKDIIRARLNSDNRSI